MIRRASRLASAQTSPKKPKKTPKRVAGLPFRHVKSDGSLLLEFDLETSSETNDRSHNWAKAHQTEKQIKAVLSNLCQCAAVKHLARKPAPIRRDPVTKKKLPALPDTTFADFVRALARECVCSKPALPWLVTLTRIAPGRLDTDNLGGALKHIQDAVARWAQVDDADEATVTYERAQSKDGQGVYRVRILIETRTPELVLTKTQAGLLERLGSVAVEAWHTREHRRALMAGGGR